jgi:hypothetical protein
MTPAAAAGSSPRVHPCVSASAVRRPEGPAARWRRSRPGSWRGPCISEVAQPLQAPSASRLARQRDLRRQSTDPSQHAGTRLRAGSARGLYGTPWHGPRCAGRALGGLRACNGSRPRTRTEPAAGRTKWGSGRPARYAIRGAALPALGGFSTGPLSESAIRHSTRRARRSFGGGRARAAHRRAGGLGAAGAGGPSGARGLGRDACPAAESLAKGRRVAGPRRARSGSTIDQVTPRTTRIQVDESESPSLRHADPRRARSGSTIIASLDDGTCLCGVATSGMEPTRTSCVSFCACCASGACCVCCVCCACCAWCTSCACCACWACCACCACCASGVGQPPDAPTSFASLVTAVLPASSRTNTAGPACRRQPRHSHGGSRTNAGRASASRATAFATPAGMPARMPRAHRGHVLA